MHGLSYAKNMSIETVKEMLIAIIDADQLMPGYPDCKAEAKKYSVAFSGQRGAVQHSGPQCRAFPPIC